MTDTLGIKVGNKHILFAHIVSFEWTIDGLVIHTNAYHAGADDLFAVVYHDASPAARDAYLMLAQYTIQDDNRHERFCIHQHNSTGEACFIYDNTTYSVLDETFANYAQAKRCQHTLKRAERVEAGLEQYRSYETGVIDASGFAIQSDSDALRKIEEMLASAERNMSRYTTRGIFGVQRLDTILDPATIDLNTFNARLSLAGIRAWSVSRNDDSLFFKSYTFNENDIRLFAELQNGHVVIRSFDDNRVIDVQITKRQAQSDESGS